MASKIKRDDTVQVMTGRDRGRRGEVRQVLRKPERAIVTGVNMVRKHRRSTDPAQPSQILDIEAAIHLSNLRLVCTALRQRRTCRFPHPGGRPQGPHLQAMRRGD